MTRTGIYITAYQAIVVALLLALLLLAGCQSRGQPITERAVMWSIEKYPSASWQARGNTGTVDGYAVWTDEGGCFIVTRPPTGPDDSETWRDVYHELRHCQEGHWH